MAKKNNRNRQFTSKSSIIDEKVVEDIKESVQTEEPVIKEETFEVVDTSQNDVPVIETDYHVLTEESKEVVSETPKTGEVISSSLVSKERTPFVNTNKKVDLTSSKPRVTKPAERNTSVVPKTKEFPKKSSSTHYQIVFVSNATPLQINKTTKRLRELNILYKYDGKDILGDVFSSEAEAIEHKKYYAGRGLKPTIRKI